MLPKFLLKKMYEKESLQKTSKGFKFTLKNNIANGNVVEVHYLKINEEPIHAEAVIVDNGTQNLRADNISHTNPFELKKSVNTVFTVSKDHLNELINKEVKIALKFIVLVRDSKMAVEFDFNDLLKA